MYFAKQTSRLLKQQVQSYQQLVKLTALNLSNYTCHDLSSLRSLVKITGQDSGKYLQNMLTNDINRLNEGNTRSIYSMVLNNRGRVLHDVLVYRINSLVQPTNEYLIEVDKAYLQDFLKMCQIYKIKKKVDISAVDSSFRLYSVTNDISTNVSQLD
jgi:folate-binding Fe-S cluster repair protein YgfZ